MIRYALVCEAGHGFESWFPSSASYDEQAARGLVTCPLCGSARVAKGPMAPSVARTDRARAPAPAGSDAPAPAGSDAPAPGVPAVPAPPLAEPERRMREMVRALRQHVASTAEHVGPRFPEEARKIHYGEVEERPIYGEASPDEARALIDEGIEVSALPPIPDDRN